MIVIDDKISKKIIQKQTDQPEESVHPWRTCSLGKHFVKECTVHIASGKKNPQGCVTHRKAHCAENPSKKDILFFDEIQEITAKHFHQLSGAPKKGVFAEYSDSDKFDSEILGWTHYWNDIFSLTVPLEPDLVKALIVSESGFRSGIDISAGKGKGRARGLMQITDETMRILGDHHGELSDHLVAFEHLKLLDPSANICAGIRWLFRKKVIANSKLGRQATWVEAVIEYKGRAGLKKPHKEVTIFLEHYQRILNG